MPDQRAGSAPPLPSDRAPLLGRPGLSQEPPSQVCPSQGITGDPLPRVCSGQLTPHTDTAAFQGAAWSI